MTRERGEGRGATGDRGGWPRLVRERAAEEMGGPENIVVEERLSGGLIIPLEGGFIRFSF